MSHPARGYSWPPFAHGHEVTMKHGAWSERRWRPLADELMAELAQTAPWCARPAFAGVVAAWARVEAMIVLLSRWFDDNGVVDSEGNPQPATALYARLETQAQSLRAELGLSPLALAKLLGALSGAPAGTDDDALDRLKREGRALVEARTAALEGNGQVDEAADIPSGSTDERPTP